MGKTTIASSGGASPRGGRSTSVRAAPAKPNFSAWSKVFLAELAATSNVTAAAKAARIATSTAYDYRRTNTAFYRDWQQALCEGYDHLEMDMLLRLRTGEIKPAAGAKKGTRTWDNATAFRLLAAHRDSASRQRAVRSRADAEAIVQSINAKLEKMKQRRLALEAAAEDASAEAGTIESSETAPAPAEPTE